MQVASKERMGNHYFGRDGIFYSHRQRELLRAPFEYKAQGKAHVRHCFSQRPRETKEGVASARRSINSHQLWNAPFATLR
jgi:hypothetical protein